MANRTKIGETEFSVGDLVKVHQKIIEGGKERSSIFQGMVISIRGKGENKSFTARRIASGGIGVERIWPLNSPWILKMELVKKGKVRRAKLYYLREKIGKKAVKVKYHKKVNKPDEKEKPRKLRREARREVAKN